MYLPAINSSVATADFGSIGVLSESRGKRTADIQTPVRLPPSVALADTPGGLALNVSSAIQDLLQLPHPQVMLGSGSLDIDNTQGAVGPRAPFGVDILPEAARIYAHMSNDRLVDAYVGLVQTFDDIATPVRVAPPAHRQLWGNIVTALRLYPERMHDIALLGEAFLQLERFFSVSRSCLRRARTQRPELAESLLAIQQESAARAITLAKAGQDISQEIMSSARLIERALERQQYQADEKSIEECRTFYIKPQAVEGAHMIRYYQARQVLDLANGNICFDTLADMLRYGPVGSVQYVQVQGSSDQNMGDLRVPVLPRTEARATYPHGLVRQLWYYENKGTARERKIPAAMGESGYSVDGGPTQEYPQRISSAVRQENLACLDSLVWRASRYYHIARPFSGIPAWLRPDVIPPR